MLRRILAVGLSLALALGPAAQVAWAHDFGMPGGTSPGSPGDPGGDPDHPGTPLGAEPPGPHQPPPNEDPGKQDEPKKDTDPVRVDRGEYFTEIQDVLILGRGLSAEFRRYYRSQSGYNGPLGYGWNFGYNTRLQQLESGNVVIVEGEDRQNEFTLSGSTFTPPAGVYAALVRNGNGTWTITYAHGQKHQFDVNGLLTAIQDRAGNQVTFGYDPAGKLPILGPSPFLVDVTTAVLVRDYRMTTITDPAGRSLTMAYNANGRIDTVTDWTGRVWTYGYDAAGNLTSVRTPGTPDVPAGMVTTYGYDADHNLTTITDAKGQLYLQNVYVADRVEQQTYGSSTSTLQYVRDLVCVPNPSFAQAGYALNLSPLSATPGSVLTATWSAPASRAGVSDSLRLYRIGTESTVASSVTSGATSGSRTFTAPTTQDEYEVRYRLSDGFTFTAISNSVCVGTAPLVPGPVTKTRVTDRNGFMTDYEFDSEGHITRQEQFTAGLRVGEPASFVTTHEYNADGERVRTVHPAGNSIEWTYDSANPSSRAHGNLLSVREKPPAGSPDPDLVTSYTYEPQFNLLKTVTDPRGNVTTYLYDYELPTADPNYGTVGNLVRITGPTVPGGQPVTRFTYNAFGQVLTVTDPNGNVTRYTYQAATGYLTQVTRGLGSPKEASTSFTPDALGRFTAITDPNTKTTQFDYNAMNQLIKVTAPAPLNFLTHYTYDANGNLIHLDRQAKVSAPGARPATGTVNALDDWQTTVYTYTALDQLATIKDDLGNATAFTYDGTGNRISVLDAEGRLTRYAHDERDLLFRVTDAAVPEGVTVYDYDANGNLASLKDANGNPTTYLYDGFDRLIRTTYADASFERYGYDPASNMTSRITPANQTITYRYDALNRLDQKTTPEEVTAYGYDLGSRLTSAVDPDATLGFGYDALDRVNSAATTYPSTAVKTATYDYDGADNRTRLTYPDGEVVTYTYDVLNRIDLIKSGAPTIADFDHDALSRRERLLLANGTTSTYLYDAANRLNSVTIRNGAAVVLQSFGYTYDNVGNRKTMTDAAGLHTYGYDPLYQLTTVDYPASFGAPDITYNYDAVGNRLSTLAGSTTAYVPNALNQYTAVGGVAQTYTPNGNLQSDGTNTYTYDSENRLIQAVAPTGTHTYGYDPFGRRIRKTVSGVITRFYYDGDQGILDTNSAGTIQGKVLFGPGIDEPLRLLRGASTSYYHADGLGSISALTNTAGAVAESYKYDVYGKPLTLSAVGNRLFFTGREYDTESGLSFHRARYYYPGLGRFLSREPAPVEPHLYRYVFNAPLSWADPDGFMSVVLGPNGGAGLPPGWGGRDTPPSISIDIPQTPQSPRPTEPTPQPHTPPGPDIGPDQPKPGTESGNKNDQGKLNGGQSLPGAEMAEVGGSGKPRQHRKRHPSRKRAEEEAQQEGKGKPIHHPNPKRGRPHFHPVDEQGNKIPGAHHEY